MNLLQPPKLPAELTQLSVWLQTLTRESKGILQFVSPPASSTAPGSIFNYSFNDTYLYICYGTDTWARIAYTDVVF